MTRTTDAALALFASAMFLAGSPQLTIAQKRVALVIGNSNYLHTSKLANPQNDAEDLAAVLRKYGIQVIEGFDLDKISFDRTVRDFAVALRGAQAGVFFYAGHGLQVNTQNYLVPVDAKAEGLETLEFEMVRVGVIHSLMEQLAGTNLIILDACRNNPLSRNLARTMGTRSAEIGAGLRQVEAGVGTLISFSTQPDNVALDGTGRNSPFAGALVRHINSSTDDLSAILIAVRNDVMKETQRKQVPWEHSALTGRFFFNPAGSTITSSQTAMAPSAPSTQQRPRTFDGVWLVKMTCPEAPDGTRGYSRQFVGRVQNGVFRAQDGMKGVPNWIALEGEIEPDGSAAIHGAGLTGTPRFSVGNVPSGTSFTFAVPARFQGASGTGKRYGGRDCDFTFAKQ